MIVFFSDIHLTDGTSGTTINPEAFELFAERVLDLVGRRHPRDVRLVLLGDGLDVIRSGRWLETDDVKPWSPPSGQQERTTLEVVEAILDSNRGAIGTLRDIPGRITRRAGGRMSSDQASLTYVLGNHDWLINRYTSCRRLVVERLGLQEQDSEAGFPLVYTCPEHQVIGRHGDIYDRFNFDAARGRDASSIGDAIVIELVNRFPLEVGKEIEDEERRKEVVARLREIDNVRPLSVIPRWVIKVSEDLGEADPALKQAMRLALDRCVEQFAEGPAYKAFVGRQLNLIQRLCLRRMLAQLPKLKLSLLDRVSRRWTKLSQAWRLACSKSASEYAAYAGKDRDESGAEPRFVIYGHTHREETVPLGPLATGKPHRFYLNTGTWRCVWEECLSGTGPREFASWKVMSYAVIYRPNEAEGEHVFETWDGRLADRDVALA